MTNQIKTEFLIIGDGIAALLFAWKCFNEKKSFLIIGDNNPAASSSIAAGMFDVVSGKRMVKSWRSDEMLPTAISTYATIENMLQISVLNQTGIFQLFGSIKEQNDFSIKLSDEVFKDYINLKPVEISGVNNKFGAFESTKGGWINARLLTHSLKEFFTKKSKLIADLIDDSSLEQIINNTHSKYLGSKIILAQGFKAHKSKFTSWLPFVLCHGEVLTIKYPENFNKIIKKGIYLVQVEPNIYKVGATYNWNIFEPNKTEQGRELIIDKLKDILPNPFEVLKQEAGIRPTTKDRKPFLGRHPDYYNVFIFNGMGTKGYFWCPLLAEEMYNFIENNIAIKEEADIARFK